MTEYQKYKKMGICIQCKKRKAHKNRVRCLDCLDKDQIYRMLRRKKTMELKNVCNICGIEAYYPEIYTTLCPYCGRVIHINHVSGCECDKSKYAINSEIKAVDDNDRT